MDIDNNALNYDLVKSVGDFFRLDNLQIDKIIKEIVSILTLLQEEANKIGVSNKGNE